MLIPLMSSVPLAVFVVMLSLAPVSRFASNVIFAPLRDVKEFKVCY